jgi:serine/threonine protein kinase
MSFVLLDGAGAMDAGIGKPIHIFRNGDCDNGKSMLLSPEWTTDAFLAAAGRRLGLTHPKRIFLVDGTEIDDILAVEDDETIFISEGPEFRLPKGSGACIAGYEVKQMLGKGGFGEVRLGVHIVTKRKVALKFMSKANMGSASAAERVATEIHCLTALHHPSVIRMYQVINQSDFTVLVFEYAAGGDLLEYVTNSESEHLTEGEARQLFRQILSAVAYAHNHNICHGDLKLENILLANRVVTGNTCEGGGGGGGGGGRAEKDGRTNSYDLEVKVADFGLSVFVNRGEKSKAVGGSTSYMSPEVRSEFGRRPRPCVVGGVSILSALIWLLRANPFLFLFFRPRNTLHTHDKTQTDHAVLQQPRQPPPQQQ